MQATLAFVEPASHEEASVVMLARWQGLDCIGVELTSLEQTFSLQGYFLFVFFEPMHELCHVVLAVL